MIARAGGGADAAVFGRRRGRLVFCLGVDVFVGLPGWKCFGQCVFHIDINWSRLPSSGYAFVSGCCGVQGGIGPPIFPAIRAVAAFSGAVFGAVFGAVLGCAALEEGKHVEPLPANR